MAMHSNIVKFPFIVSRRAHARKPQTSKNGTPEERAAKRVPAGVVELSLVRAEAGSTAKRDGRSLRANPLRATFAPISPAVTIVGKMHTAENRDIGALSNLGPDIIKEWLNELRVGADSARIVASELDRAAEYLLTQAKEAMTREEIVEAYLRLRAVRKRNRQRLR
jgi:hypothetical protein